MDTSRIGQFLGLAPKLGNPGEDAQSAKSGFADLLLGVMNKRLSTVRPLPPPAKVAGLTPTAPLTPTTNISSNRATSPAPGAHKPETGKPAPATTRAAETGSPRPQPTDDTNHAAKKVQSAGTPPSDPAEDAVEATLESAETGTPAEQVETPEEGSDASDMPTEDDTEQDAHGDSEGEADDHADDHAGDLGGEPLPQQADTMTVPAAAIPIQVPLATGTDTAALDPADTPNAETATDAPTETAEGSSDVAPGNHDAGPAAGLAATAGAALAAASDPQSNETQARANAAAAQGERRAEDAAAMFRRNQSASRQRATATGAGPTGTTSHAATAATPGLPSRMPGALTTNPATTLSPIGPLGFDAGFGPGLPGRDLHLGQGAGLRRLEFLANLRQHLQNLPAHEQVALSVKRVANDGGGRITLQLSPAELGRIHVKLDIDEEKHVRASIAVERPSTLELLQRDLRALERALQDAGLKTAQHELSLSLQGGDPEAFARQFGAEGDERGPGRGTEGDAGDDADMAKAPGIVATGDGLVDVQI